MTGSLERFILVLAAGGTVLAPLCAFGHSSEFILAKIRTLSPGQLSVEITADYGSNPMLADESEARAALLDLLLVRLQSGTYPLRELGDLRFERRSNLDADSPVPTDPEDSRQPHQLLTATWHWRPTEDRVAFQVQPKSAQSVILWKSELGQPASQARWAMLMAGDLSPPVEISKRASLAGPVGAVCASAAALLAIGWRRKR